MTTQRRDQDKQRREGATAARRPEIPAPLRAVARSYPAFAAALDLHARSNYGEARKAFLDLADQPVLTPWCLHQLGVIAAQRGEQARSVALLRQAIRLDPGQPLFYGSLGSALEAAGDLAGAINVLIELAVMLQTHGRQADALPYYRRALSLDPLRYGAWINLGTAMCWAGQSEEAVPLLLRGLELYGRLVPEVDRLGGELREHLAGRLGDAGAVPALPAGPPTGPIEKIEDALVTLGKAVGEMGFPDDARACYRLATTLAPGYALAHWNLALILLSQGAFAEGWREYEWRWQWDRFPEPRRLLPVPQWRGEDPAGRRLYVFAEQGYGDAIQFLPLVTELARRGAEVTYEVPTPLLRLMRDNLGARGITVVERPHSPHLLGCAGRFDFLAAEMSLPGLLGESAHSLPMDRNYLHAAPGESERWRAFLADRQGPKVGVAWAGRHTHADDAKRSLPLPALRRLVEATSVQWVSLQIGPRQGEATEFA